MVVFSRYAAARRNEETCSQAGTQRHCDWICSSECCSKASWDPQISKRKHTKVCQAQINDMHGSQYIH